MVSLCDDLSTARADHRRSQHGRKRKWRLIGHNTDGIGYMQSVKDAGYDIIAKR